jgi:hypothetical protein
MESIPLTFKPSYVGKRHSIVVFKSIPKGYQMTVEEKEWLCFEVYKNDDNSFQSPDWVEQVRTKKGLIARYNLNPNWFKKHWPIFIDQKRRFHESAGHPESVDDDGWSEIAQLIENHEKELNYIPSSELDTFINGAVQSTHKRRYGTFDVDFFGLESRALKQLKLDHGIVQNLPDSTTDARLAACLCPRMSYVWYLVCWALSRTLPGFGKWNADASTYVFEPKGSGDTICSLAADSDLRKWLTQIDAEEENEMPLVTVPNVRKKSKGKNKSQSVDNSLPFAIKVVQHCNASGKSGPACVVIAIKQMPSDVWFVQEVMGLSWVSRIGAKGVVYFCKTRCGTKAMWSDWFTRVAVPTIAESNIAHAKHLHTSDGAPFTNHFSTDGEDIILSNIYTNDAVQRAFANHNITYSRVGVGTTGIHNACDRAYTFRETKSAVRKCRKQNKSVTNELLEETMPTAFSALQEEYPSVQISSLFKKNIIDGLSILMYAYQHTMTPDMVKRGFSVCGQHVPKDEHGHTVSFDIMMNQCYTDIPAEYLDIMRAKTSELSQVLLANGMVTWQDMDRAGILSVPQSINRDALTHIRHWSEIVSHKEVIQRYAEEQQRRDPVFIAQQREEEQARAYLNRLEGEQLKKERAAEKRRLESERFQALLPTEQKEEKANKRQAASVQKLLKLQEALDKERAARALLSNNPARIFTVGGNQDTSDSEEEGEMDSKE